MIRALYLLLRYRISPTVKRWREIRSLLMGWLPKVEKSTDIEENGK